MIVIKLFCQAGMSTSLLVYKMNQSAKERGIDCQIKAYPAGSLMTEVPSADVVLLGPQLSYLQADALRFAKPHTFQWRSFVCKITGWSMGQLFWILL